MQTQNGEIEQLLLDSLAPQSHPFWPLRSFVNPGNKRLDLFGRQGRIRLAFGQRRHLHVLHLVCNVADHLAFGAVARYYGMYATCSTA